MTPLTLRLRRDEGHVIVIEIEGYASAKIVIESKKYKRARVAVVYAFLGFPLILAGGVAGGFASDAIFPERHPPDHINATSFIVGALLGMVPGTLLVIYNLQPKSWAGLEPESVYIFLKKEGEADSFQTIYLTAERLANVRWIRIACAEEPGEDLVELKMK